MFRDSRHDRGGASPPPKFFFLAPLALPCSFFLGDNHLLWLSGGEKKKHSDSPSRLILLRQHPLTSVCCYQAMRCLLHRCWRVEDRGCDDARRASNWTSRLLAVRFNLCLATVWSLGTRNYGRITLAMLTNTTSPNATSSKVPLRFGWRILLLCHLLFLAESHENKTRK